MMIGQQCYAASVTTMKVENVNKVYAPPTAQFMIVVDFTIVSCVAFYWKKIQCIYQRMKIISESDKRMSQSTLGSRRGFLRSFTDFNFGQLSVSAGIRAAVLITVLL